MNSFRLLLAPLLAAGSFIYLSLAPAEAADRWQEAASGAVAILPGPWNNRGITNATLYCKEQRWGFLLRVDEDLLPPGAAADGTVTVDGDPFPVVAIALAGGLDLPVPHEILQPLRESGSMGIVIGEGKAARKASFSLRGSRVVIDAIVPRCSQVDMSAYPAIALSETDPAVTVAGGLMAEEAELVRAFTGKAATLAAATKELDGGKALLFASLCGSTSYYGLSGCTIAGFVRSEAAGDWAPAYNTEGARLFLDETASNGGFPGIVSLPTVGDPVPAHWIWTGETYELRETVMAEQDETPEEEGDTAQ